MGHTAGAREGVLLLWGSTGPFSAGSLGHSVVSPPGQAPLKPTGGRVPHSALGLVRAGDFVGPAVPTPSFRCEPPIAGTHLHAASEVWGGLPMSQLRGQLLATSRRRVLCAARQPAVFTTAACTFVSGVSGFPGVSSTQPEGSSEGLFHP